MRPAEALTLYRTQNRELALRHHVSGVRVFGSALRGDDTAESDLDLLAKPTAQTTLMDMGAIRSELKQLLGTEVDVLTPSLPASFRDYVPRQALAVGAERTRCGWQPTCNTAWTPSVNSRNASQDHRARIKIANQSFNFRFAK